ncbi:hypothetical protein BD560DRAFT_428589 [Blakeslea trispora]|nr:hypothetical protein BD560DRAFT_428589 [Blakeslea trispora]
MHDQSHNLKDTLESTTKYQSLIDNLITDIVDCATGRVASSNQLVLLLYMMLESVLISSASTTITKSQSILSCCDKYLVTRSVYPECLDFANTEEIPVFLRNWNVNKKRRFKPKISNCSPAKRQRRSGPDSHNHSDSINRL